MAAFLSESDTDSSDESEDEGPLRVVQAHELQAPRPWGQAPRAMDEAPSALPVRVVASTLGGASAELEALSTTKVWDVKELLAEKLKVPAICQKLLLDTKVLEDSRHLSQYGTSELSLTVLVSTEGMYRQLHRRESDEKALLALQALVSMELDCEEAISALEAALEYRPQGLRVPGRYLLGCCDVWKVGEVRGIVKANLLKLSGRGSREAFECYDKHFLGNADAWTRESAINELGETFAGNEAVRASLIAGVGRHRYLGPRELPSQIKCDAWLVAARLEALGRVCSEVDADGLQCALQVLSGKKSNLVKLVAFDSLKHVLKASREQVAPVARDFFVSCLNKEVRKEAQGRPHYPKLAWNILLEHMSEHAERNSKELCAACERALLKGLPRTSEVAGQVFPLVADSENAQVIDRLLSELKLGVLSHQRATAAKVLGALSGREDEQVVRALVAALADTAEVAQASVTSLGQVGGAAALEAVLARLQHPDGWVRRAAPPAVARLAVYGGEAAVVQALVACAQSPDYGDAAEAALAALGGMGAGAADGLLEAAGACVRGRDLQLRRAAVAALGRLGEAPSHGAGAVAALTEAASPASWLDDDECVQGDAVSALQKLAGSSGEAAADALHALAGGRHARPAGLAQEALRLLAAQEDLRLLAVGEAPGGGAEASKEAGGKEVRTRMPMPSVKAREERPEDEAGEDKREFESWTRLLQSGYISSSDEEE